MEAEFFEAMSYANPRVTVIDVGANIGIYTYGFLARGATVHAFEPQPTCVSVIRSFYDAGLPLRRRGKLFLHPVALGDHPGTSRIHIPLRDGRPDTESASLGAVTAEAASYEVALTTIDEYDLRDLAFIKIDVEGGELSVIEGGRRTIARERPAILVEVEQRHHGEPLRQVFANLRGILGPGYAGFYMDVAGSLRPLDHFDVERDQLSNVDNPLSRAYIRNFLFRSSGADAPSKD